ncbi:transcriptional regulator, LacI family [Variovorax sp. PDC80]|uniref:LacI family DNA-binding transcriptional regulator n=1 Tax=Variovorax sp. PDC80 TaxID=1882827 RepID=UPI0008E0C8EC|nr:LacI family DNA-binding transcriptional regulator [Variovorax sp. PDC80]SFP17448.1 transcriptional regulator, LacI family [Variovorax sp. PDC80]
MSRAPSQAVSLRDVARAAETSVATVSRVLNHSGYVSAEVRKRVEKAAQGIGYVPNFSARHLKTGRSKAIGFMVSNMANPFLSAFFAAVEARLQSEGFSVLVGSTFDQPQREAQLLHLFENRRLEGVFVSPSREDLPAAQDAFARCKLPLVVLDRETGFEADAVCQDHRQGVATAVDYLVSLGHRRIALFGPNPAIRPGREKLLGYRDGLRRADIGYDEALVCMLSSAIESSAAQMDAMLALAAPPTALIALGTRLLSGALRSARERGLRIPAQLSVVGIGTDDAFALMDPPLTTLRFDIEGAAHAAAELMLERVEGRAPEARRSVHVPLALTIGASCAAPAR